LWSALLPLLLAACGTGERYGQMALESKVDQAVSAYESGRLKGDPLDLCVKARLVAIAYDDAGKPAERDAWKARETADCQAAYARFNAGAPPPLTPAQAGTQNGGP
jgi:hypothetical protein